MRQPSIEQWDLRRKIGQMVMCGFQGTEPSSDIIRLIRDDHVGGVIYFRRNIRHAGQVLAMSAELQQAAAANGGDAPLFIAVDQEGGMVARIDQGVTVMPGNMTLGATRDAELAGAAARMSAAELRQIGVNMNFAPCLDVNNNPANPVIGVRSYGEDPELVAELGTAAIRGYQEAGVAACAKHFPGHGDTVADSHLTMPTVPHSRERLQGIELLPFRAAIEAGVDAIMTAHVRFPAYDDSGIPATLSPRILSGLLREELGYDGVIVTDCLEMRAITDSFGTASGAVQAVQAGADLVLVSHTYARQKEVLEALYEAVQSGELPESRIDESVRRIVQLKLRRVAAANNSGFGSGADLAAASGGKAYTASTAEHRAMVRRICERGITLLRNEGGLPLRRDEPVLAVWPEVRRATEIEEIIPQETTIGHALAKLMSDVREAVISTEPSPDEVDQVLRLAREGGYRQIVVGTYNAVFSEGQTRLIRELAALPDVTLIVAALRNPYDILVASQVRHYIACYENRPAMIETLAELLVGEIQAAGKLPVSLA